MGCSPSRNTYAINPTNTSLGEKQEKINSVDYVYQEWKKSGSKSQEKPKKTSEIWSVTPRNGFLPLLDPLITLPEEFSELETLMQELPYTKEDGNFGLLKEGKVASAIEKITQYDLSKIDDERLLNALYRDYTFLASAYLLENCHLRYLTTGKHGLGRDVLPS
jgi:indoleamine 2,3-dioxygenase